MLMTSFVYFRFRTSYTWHWSLKSSHEVTRVTEPRKFDISKWSHLGTWTYICREPKRAEQVTTRNGFQVRSLVYHNSCSGDAGFPLGGGANHAGAPTYDFPNFRRKLHENEIFAASGGSEISPRRGRQP